jgi:hypothetical protein
LDRRNGLTINRGHKELLIQSMHVLSVWIRSLECTSGRSAQLDNHCQHCMPMFAVHLRTLGLDHSWHYSLFYFFEKLPRYFNSFINKSTRPNDLGTTAVCLSILSFLVNVNMSWKRKERIMSWLKRNQEYQNRYCNSQKKSNLGACPVLSVFFNKLELPMKD